MNLTDIAPKVPPDILALTGSWWHDHWQSGREYRLRYTISSGVLEYNRGRDQRWNHFPPNLIQGWIRYPGADHPHPEILEVVP